MLRFYCESCQEHQPVTIESIEQDTLNDIPWGDIVCKNCAFVIATVSADEELQISAPLWKAAPDLLMALRWALQWVCPPSKPPYGTSEAESEYTQMMEDWRNEHEQARAAISAAEPVLSEAEGTEPEQQQAGGEG